MTVFAQSQTTNKLVNEAANDSARVTRQDRKIPPALGTNQIAGFGGFRPLASLEKKIKSILRQQIFLSHVDNVLSSKASFLSGVPQGAMIGTAPFIDYTHERSSEMGPRVLFKYMTVIKSITLAFSL